MNRLTSLSLTALALALPAGAALTAPADALTRTEYAVTIAGSADYNRADVDGDVSAQHDISWDFQTKIPKLTFLDNAAEDSTGALGTAAVKRGAWTVTGESGSFTCTDHELLGTEAGGLDATARADGVTFATRVMSSIDVLMRCSSVPVEWNMHVDNAGAAVGDGIFDGAIFVPNDQIGEKQLIFPLQGEVTGAECPSGPITVLCSLTWNATVTFTRISADVEPEPIVPDPGTEDELLVPIVAKAKLAAGMRSVGLPISCAQACSGTVAAAAGPKTLGRTRFAGAAGETPVATVRLDAADRRAIKRAGKVKLTVRASAGEEVLKRTLTLRAR